MYNVFFFFGVILGGRVFLIFFPVNFRYTQKIAGEFCLVFRGLAGFVIFSFNLIFVI